MFEYLSCTVDGTKYFDSTIPFFWNIFSRKPEYNFLHKPMIAKSSKGYLRLFHQIMCDASSWENPFTMWENFQRLGFAKASLCGFKMIKIWKPFKTPKVLHHGARKLLSLDKGIVNRPQKFPLKKVIASEIYF